MTRSSKMPFDQAYARWEHLISERLLARPKNLNVFPQWVTGSDSCWLKLDNDSGHKYWLIDASTGNAREAFDHTSLARALEASGHKGAHENSLAVENLTFDSEGSPICTVNGDQYHWDVQTASFKQQSLTEECALKSPRGNASVTVKGDNLWITDSDQNTKQLTVDGTSKHAYGDSRYADVFQIPRRRAGMSSKPGGIHWSPCGKFLIALRLNRSDCPERTLVCEYADPSDTFQKSLLDRFRVAADHTPPKYTVDIIDVENGAQRKIDFTSETLCDFAVIFLLQGNIWWTDEYLFLITANWCGDRYGLARIHLREGSIHQVIEERAEHYFTFNQHDYNRPNVHVLSNGLEAIWYSDRDGYGHLYYYEVSSGNLIRQLTMGEWVVYDLLHVDETNRVVIFSAAGKEAGENPYYRHLYRVPIAGGEPELICPEEADHQFDAFLAPGLPRQTRASVSPSGKYVFDCFSSIDSPPVGILRKTDGSRVSKVYETDISNLESVDGWSAPSPIKTLASDGKTNLYGIMYLPDSFDESEKYPVIACTYPGPQARFAPTSFHDAIRNPAVQHGQLLANLGFVVIAFDGRGCTGRSRDFRYAHARSEDVFGSSDHVAGLKQLSSQFPFIDLDRVGIVGSSFGGYGALRATLLHPGFFKACVSCVGPCDYRFMGAELSNDRFFRSSDDVSDDGEFYETINNRRLIENLTAKLLLIYGELDENVPLNQAFLLFEALQKAQKPYDSLLLTNVSHVVTSDAFCVREIARYFHDNL